MSIPTPRLSILTAVRDALPHVDEAIGSIRDQSWSDWEWVLVDDGSVDGTRQRLREHARREPRLRLIERPAAGLVPALRSGLDACRAPLIARMDADDIALPDRLALQVAALDDDPSLTVVDGRVELFGGVRNDGMRRYVDWLNEHTDHASISDDIFVESPIVHPAVCFRRAAVAGLGGYRAGDFPEDYDLWLRLHAAGARFRKLPATVLRWRDRSDRLTRTDPRYRDAAFTLLKQQSLWDLEGDAIAGDGMVLWGAARGTRSWRQWLRGHAVRPAFIVDANPKRQGHSMLGAPVLAPETVPERRWRYMLVTVSSPDSRAEIRWRLTGWGYAADPERRIRFV